MNATSPVCSHCLYITTQKITYCMSTDKKLRGLFRTYLTVRIAHVYTHFFLHIFNTCWSSGNCFDTPGIHKSVENLVVTSEFLESDGWHKASLILGIHNSGVTCSHHCNLALSTCARNVTDISYLSKVCNNYSEKIWRHR